MTDGLPQNPKLQSESSSSAVANENPQTAPRPQKRASSKSRISFNPKISEVPQADTKASLKPESKTAGSVRGPRPVERLQFREHIASATADRKISQRIIQKEAFKSFSEQINTRVILLVFDK